MNDTKTPVEQAAERYPVNHAMDPMYMDGVRDGHAACLEERAIPAERRVAELEAENARLRDDAQVAAEALGEAMKTIAWSARADAAKWTTNTDLIDSNAERSITQYRAALAKLAENGITPTDR
jgi:hypothetical protein